MPSRMNIKYTEIAQDLAITHGIAQETVDLIMGAYSAAVNRALEEDFIVEVAQGVRLQSEEYFDPRNNRTAKRLAVTNNRHLGRNKTKKAEQDECPPLQLSRNIRRR